MLNNWISKVTGQPVVETAVPESGRKRLFRQIVGEADEENKPEEKSEPEEKDEPAEIKAPATDLEKPEGAESEAAVDAGIEAGAEAAANTSIDSQTVQHLVSSWESGSKMDVASELMYTPVSYVDFAKLLYRIGEESGTELGALLDELSDVRPSIDQPGGEQIPDEAQVSSKTGQGSGAERILSKIASRRHGQPEIEPAGETSLSHDSMP